MIINITYCYSFYEKSWYFQRNYCIFKKIELKIISSVLLINQLINCSLSMEAFLQQDRQRRFKEARAQEKEQLDKIKAQQEREKKIQLDREEYRRQWMSFYDGKGFGMVMLFVWDFGHRFFVSPVDLDSKENHGHKFNYVWSNPDYPGGDNTIRPFEGTIKDFFGSSFGRDKGSHVVRSYCGDETTFINQ